MDILLNPNGDLYLSPQGDILLTHSLSQKIKMKLNWLEGEWRWKKEEGLPYRDCFFVKNPDIDALEAQIREKIFEVEEVTEVRKVEITFDPRTRKATIAFVALADQDVIREEVKMECLIMG